MTKKRKNRVTYRKYQTVRTNTGGNSTTGQSSKRWNEKGILMLLSLVKELQEEIDTGKFQNDFYKKISCAMKNYGYNFQPSQCQAKIYSLVKRYTQIKYNNQAETDEKWEYYDAVEELLGDNENPALSSAPISQTRLKT